MGKNIKNSEKARIFITGAGGFVGRNLTEYLKQQGNYELFCPYHRDLELLDPAKVEEYVISHKIDVIVHSANRGGSRKEGYNSIGSDIFYKNVRMFFNLARCLKHVKKMIHLGSGAEFDRRNYTPKMTEDFFDTFVPEDDYGFSKYVCNKFIMETKKPIVNLRLFANFGKYEDYEFRFISNSILKNLLGLPITIRQNVNFEFLYVNDLVRIIEHFINNDAKYKAYNIATGKPVDLVSIADKINEISKNPTEVIVCNPGLNNEYTADNTRLMEELKDFKFTPIEKSIQQLYEWYKDNLNSLDVDSVIKDKYINACRVRKE
ncbi:MAG: NAD-dependent epimerase/dehydratase family protein [Candidatus Omnitrophica bacterium]|nr:NAD-dependent epimerase/dehydratase family protein [Candidatus Omnitrophota bacterium]